MKLYGIEESEIVANPQFPIPQVDGAHEFVWDTGSRQYPLKFAVALKADILSVVTVYPLKKGRKP